MVYIHFPTHLTEEELMLQAKYQKLKKKKKALQALKAKPEPEKPAVPKRPADARDAREVARKLIKSGAIPAIQKQPTKQDQASFKRPKGQERKKLQQDQSVTAYQPFSSTQNDVAQDTIMTDVSEKETSRVQDLYQQFASGGEREERNLNEKKNSGSRGDKPRTGHTIFVSGNKVTEEYLKTHFSEFGTILNISMETEKGRGFITFTKPDSAERAIQEMHSKNIAGIQLQVQLARRQPQIEPINEASSSAAWSAIAARQPQKREEESKREMVQYDDDFLNF